MTEVVVERSGYRLRDLVAGLVVVQIAIAVVYAIRTSVDTALEIPAILLGGGLALVALAYGIGCMLDRLGERYPSLGRPRRCPRVLLFAVPAITCAVAYRHEPFVDLVSGLCQQATGLLA